VTDFKMGDTIRFTDANAIGKPGDDTVRVVTGVVNGEPTVTGEGVYVPVFASRIGREATTIWVDANNILAVEDSDD
jgi:hypothetical protein